MALAPPCRVRGVAGGRAGKAAGAWGATPRGAIGHPVGKLAHPYRGVGQHVAGRNRGGSGNEGRRPTKAERREDARRQREEIQRRMARRRRNRSLSLVLVVVAIAVAVVAVFL